jgi:hypothetical protein
MTDSKLTSEQLVKLQEISTIIFSDKQLKFIKNDCDCRVYMYDKSTDNIPSCAVDWYYFMFELLIPKMFKKDPISHVKNILNGKISNDKFHPIDYLWFEYLKVYGKERQDTTGGKGILVKAT